MNWLNMANGRPNAPLPPAAIPPKVRYSSSTKYAKLKGLRCFKEVHEMVVSGWPLTEIAQYIQKQRSEYLDVTESTLLWTLTSYRKDLPPGELLAKTMPSSFKKAADKVRKGLDELAELEALYELQMKRINIDFKTEQKINKLMPTMTYEIRAAKDILKDMSQLKMDLGLDERHIGKLDLNTGPMPEELVAKYGRESVGKVLGNPESRRKLLALVEKFAQVQTAREAIDPAAADSEGEPPVEVVQDFVLKVDE